MHRDMGCNYDEGATLNDGSCVFPDLNGQCQGVCDSDLDGDGICDANEIAGCTYIKANNYVAVATDDDGSCNFLGCVLPTTATTMRWQTQTMERARIRPGVQTSTAMVWFNWRTFSSSSSPTAQQDPTGDLTGSGWMFCRGHGHADMDVSTSGCTYPTAANFDPTAVVDMGTCVWLG